MLLQHQCPCVVTSTPDGTAELPDETQISIIPSRSQTPTIPTCDDELEAGLLPCDCGPPPTPAAGTSTPVDVHDQTTLTLDFPDNTQTHLMETKNPLLECRSSRQSRSLTPDYSPRICGKLQAQSSQSLNQEFKRNVSPKCVNENQKLPSSLSRHQGRYIIPISSSTILGTLHPGSSARNRNGTPKLSPKNISGNLQPDLKQTCCNQSSDLTSEATTNANENLSDVRETSPCPNSYLLSESSTQDLKITKDPASPSQRYRKKNNPLPRSESPKQTTTKALIKGSYTVIQLENIQKNNNAPEDDGGSPGPCQCKCHCKKYITFPCSGFPKENMSASEINDLANSEECKCKCDCENLETSDKATGSDGLLHSSLEDVQKKVLRPPENDDKQNSQECQCICPCKIIKLNPQECQCVCSCNEIKRNSQECQSVCPCKETSPNPQDCQCICHCKTLTSITTNKESTMASSRQDTHSTRELNSSRKEDVSCCTPDESRQDTHSIRDLKTSLNEDVSCCTPDETRPCDASENRWLVSPERILRGIEALRRTFLGTNEDDTSIWINKTPDSQLSTSNNITATTSNIRPKKSVSIQLPRSSSKCDYCNVEGSREGGEISGHNMGESEEMFVVENTGPISSCSTLLGFLEMANRSSEGLTDARRIRMTLQKYEQSQDSGGSSCAGAGAVGAGACGRYYRDKLLATLQVLENKEETIRVQGCSLGVAEARITELTKRASELRQELDHKARELNQLRQFAGSCRVDTRDTCISAEIKDARALQDDLAAITVLYRECFYEAAKQEELIDMLRKSYLDVRLMEKNKSDKITRLQQVIDTQKRSIEQCQDVVVEVESLKSEISSFLNSSNNDSGMWERGSESPDVGEELADILEQLRQLQHMLTSDCTCGLEEENSSLKQRNRTLETELQQERQRNTELDGSLRHILDQQYEKQIKDMELKVQEAMKKLSAAENTSRERGETCETLARQLQQAQVMLKDKGAELAEAKRGSAAKDADIAVLRRNLEQSEQLVQQGLKKLSEVTQSRSQLLLDCQARISELEQRLKNAVRRCRDLEADCRERERSAAELQSCLEEAHARGARLCDESRRVAAGVRQWMRDKKRQTREQQEKIKMQKLRIRELERCIPTRQNIGLTSQSEIEPCSSVSNSDETYTCSRRVCKSEMIPPRGSLAGCAARGSETTNCSKCAFNRQSGVDVGSCSRAPVPPTRKKRQQSCDDLSCPSISRPVYQSSHPDIRWTRLCSRLPRAGRTQGPPRPLPADEVLERVEHLHAALEDGQRRWGRHHR